MPEEPGIVPDAVEPVVPETPPADVVPAEPAIAEPEKPVEPAPADAPADKPLGEIMQPEDAPTAPVETVPLAAFLDLKKENKEHKRLIDDLQKKVDNGTISQVPADLAALAEKYDVDKEFVGELAAVLTKSAEDAAEARIAPMKEQERKAAIDKAFEAEFSRIMERMPEYTGVANKDAIKSLSLLPGNAKKTLAQLIEETFGGAITGKRTIEPNKPGGRNEPGPVDVSRARKDPEYFKEVMANPETKAEYNKKMLEQF